MSLRELVYELYKIDWENCYGHKFTHLDRVKLLIEYNLAYENGTCHDSLNDFLAAKKGFYTFDKFMENCYTDECYVYGLLQENDSMMNEYYKDLCYYYQENYRKTNDIITEKNNKKVFIKQMDEYYYNPVEDYSLYPTCFWGDLDYLINTMRENEYEVKTNESYLAHRIIKEYLICMKQEDIQVLKGKYEIDDIYIALDNQKQILDINEIIHFCIQMTFDSEIASGMEYGDKVFEVFDYWE